MTVYILDLFGTFVFAVSGAFRAVKYELDILGVAVLEDASAYSRFCGLQQGV